MHKLREMKLYTYAIPMVSGDIRRGIVLEIFDEEGRRGVGEIAPLPGWSHESFEKTVDFTKQLRDKIAKGDFSPITFPPSVMFGMESALKHLMEPLDRDLTFTTTSLISKEEDVTGEVKLKLGHYKLEDAIVLVEKLLERKITLRIDLNRQWEFNDIVAFCNHFTPEDFLYIEEPVKHFTALAAFYEKTGYRYALDETLLHHPLERVLKLPGLSHLILKPTLQGGFTQCQKILQQAKECECVFSSAYETTIGLSHIVRIAHELSPHQSIGIDTDKLLTTHPLKCPLKGRLEKSIYNTMPLHFDHLNEI